MKRNLLVQIALLLAFGGFAQMLPQRGPVNPEYLKYQDNLSKGLVSNVTADGHGLGYVPPVFKPDFSNYVPMNNPATLPAVYDMRTNGRLTSVKNQGGCGSCWTFATMGSMESRWKVLGLGDNDLSENNLKNCHLFDWTPCFGGNFNLSSAYMARRAGPVNETSDPYSATEQSCTTGLTPVAYEYSGCFLPANAAVIKQNLMDNGAIYTTFFWQDASYNSTNYTYYYSGTTETNHAVTIVGWDDTKVTAGGTGAWIIKNSWGSSWGESGYFYISYNDSRILTENGYFPSRSAYTATTKIYNYDDLGWIGNWGFSNAVGYGLVKYIASNNWPITKVGTWCNTSNTTIDIEIYDTFSGGTLSGLLGTLSGQSAPYPGYYLYDLPASIPMASGNDFYVKVKYNSPGALYPVPSEEVVAGYSSNVTIQTGKCWLSGDGTSWLALGTGTSYLFDLCIKAYTAQSSSTESIITLGTSANGLSYGVSGGQRTMLWADDNLKTVVNIHRMGPGTTPPGLSGYLATDIGTAMGQTTASWTVNRQAYASTLLSGTAYIDGGRYPQAAIYNPAGNTNQSNAYIGYFSANLINNNGWGGYSRGVQNLVNQGDSTKHLIWASPPPEKYVPSGFSISQQGIALAADFDYNSITMTYGSALVLSRGTWNSTTHDFNYTQSTVSLPLTTGTLPLTPRVAFSPDGQTAWVVALANNGVATQIGTYKNYYPVLYKSVNAGQTWTGPITVQLDGPNGITGVEWYLSDYRIKQIFPTGTPTRNLVPYTTAFDCDLAVDAWGNPHIGVVIGVSTADYSISMSDSSYAAFDIYSSNGGSVWKGQRLGYLKQFRGNFPAGGTYTEDNRMNVSTSMDGKKMFFTWLETQVAGATDNSQPDIFARGFDVEANKITGVSLTGGCSDVPTNVTGATAFAHNAPFLCASHYVFTLNGNWIIPMVFEQLTGNDVGQAVTYKYISDFTYTPNDFCTDAQNPPIYAPPINFAATVINTNTGHLSWEPDYRSPTPSGYNVYRNQVKINTNLITATSFDDPGLANGIYTYKVNAVYGANVSTFTDSRMINVGPAGPILTISPANATAYDQVTLTFNPQNACFQSGSLIGSPVVKLHSGVTVNGNPWSYPISFDATGANGQSTSLTQNSNGTYSITYTPSAYYGFPAGTVVTQLCIVFNNGMWGSKDGRDVNPAGSGCIDFFVPLSTGIGPPVADFNASNTTPYTNQTVIFTDLSTNTPTSWQWTFNPATVTFVDGTTATSKNPHVQFTAAGQYSVTLQATNANGNGSTTKTNYITVTQNTSVQRNQVVMEVGDGTWSYYDPGAALGEHDLVTNGCQVAMINYHNGDPYANTSSDARNTYYNIAGFPTAFFDGVLSYIGGSHSASVYSNYLPLYQQRYAVLSPLTIDIAGTASGNNYNVTLTVHKLSTITATNLKLHLALTESAITYAWQGQDHLDHVERLMVPDASGTTISFATANTQVINLSFAKDAAWVAANCELIAFVQDNDSKEIFNGSKVNLTAIASILPPTGLLATVTGSNVHLSWSAPAGVTGLTGYNVYRGTTKINSSVVTAVYYDDNGLSNGTYSYTVKALYGTTESTPAGPAMAYVGATYQGPVTKAGIAGAPINTPVTIPITVDYFTNITALSLRLDYDPTQVTYTGYANANSLLSGFIINEQTVSPTLHKIMMIWSDLVPKTIPTGGKIVDLNFTYLTGTAALTWNNTASGGTECEYADAIGNPLPDTPTAMYYLNGEVHFQPGFFLSGVFRYNNTATTLLDNVKVVLKQGTARVDSTTTNADGVYTFPTVQNGTYKVLAYTTKAWSSVNATDAIKVQRHFAGLELLTEPVRLLAGDVNLSNSINATDAIKIKRRFSGLDTYFDRGDWTFAKQTIGGDTIIVSGAAVSQDFFGLCVGDVNGSNTPTSGKTAQSTISLVPEGEMEILPGQEFELPIRVDQSMDLGAVSLVITYPDQSLSITNVTIKQGSLLYKATGNELRIAWSEIEPMLLNSKDALITLHLKAAQTLSSTQPLTFGLTGESELADGYGVPIADVTLISPMLKTGNATNNGDETLGGVSVYPNPTGGEVKVEYHLSQGCLVTVTITDVYGQLIRQQINSHNTSGTYNQQFDLTDVSAGVYMVKITCGNDGKETSRTLKLVKRK